MRYESPLRYPGGKARLANYFKALFLENDLVDSEYVEPYAGGASVALALLFGGYASRIHINDLSRPIVAFWRSALNHTEALCRRVRDCRVTVDNYRRQKAILKHAGNADTLALGFAAFFVNRTSRSGIIGPRSGAIGGIGQEGEWKLDARFGKAGLVQRIEAVARRRRDIKVYHEDAVEFLKMCVRKLPSQVFIYLDPPYYRNGQRLYQNSYAHKDHVAVAGRVAGLKCPWALSYDDMLAIKRMYAGREFTPYSVPYSAGKRYDGREILFLSSGLRHPLVSEPARFTDQGFREWIKKRASRSAV